MPRMIVVDPSYSLPDTCAPVDWSNGRWANQDWIDGTLYWAGWEGGALVYRHVRAVGNGALEIDGSAGPSLDRDWAVRTLGIERAMPEFTDPVVHDIAERHAGLRPHTSGSLFDGLVDSIVGQSITVLAAAVVSTRLASYFHPGFELQGRIFWPSPRAEDLANADPARLRRTGVTWKRAEALVAAGQAVLDGRMVDQPKGETIEDLRQMLRALPLVGAWTAESALLWGIGADDAFPTGDVALLRAARSSYGLPDMSMKELDVRAKSWAGHRAWAARLLWINLFGPASASRYSTR